MKAIICRDFAPLEHLEYTEVADPVARPGELLIAIRAAGVNYPDALLVQGLYQAKPALPFIPGAEFAGEVIGPGDNLEGVSPGSRVMGVSMAYGAYAEKIAFDARRVIPIPDSMPYTDAANLVCAHGTAQHALKQRARLQPGETLLVLGAAGGTGLAAVQIGKAMGARVIAACSCAERLAIARKNGADELINYTEQDLKKTLKALTHGRGVDVAYDPVGGDAFNACSRSMAINGRLLVIGFASGTIPQLPINLPLVKEYSLVGVFWGQFSEREPALFADNMKELFHWYDRGEVCVVTDAAMPLAETAGALTRMMRRQVKGKLVLVP